MKAMTRFLKAISMIAIALLLTTACEETADNKTLLTDGIWNFSNMTTDSESEATQALIFLGKALRLGHICFLKLATMVRIRIVADSRHHFLKVTRQLK